MSFEKKYVKTGDIAREFNLSPVMVMQIVDNPDNHIEHFRTPGTAKKSGERRINWRSFEAHIFKGSQNES